MSNLRAKAGLLNHRDGSGKVEHARFYYGAGEEPPPNRTTIDPDHYATWTEADGVVGIRRGTTVSVGATATYSANYDAVDWGN